MSNHPHDCFSVIIVYQPPLISAPPLRFTLPTHCNKTYFSLLFFTPLYLVALNILLPNVCFITYTWYIDEQTVSKVTCDKVNTCIPPIHTPLFSVCRFCLLCFGSVLVYINYITCFNLELVSDVLPCSFHSSHNSFFTPSIFFLLTRFPQMTPRRSLWVQTFPETHSSSFEGVDPLVGTHPPWGTWDESAAERYITTQSTGTPTFWSMCDCVCL